MIKVLAIGGMPGTGKSTLMGCVMAQLNDGMPWERVKLTDLVDAEKCGDVYVIGKYDEGEVFPGTDKLSMAVQPKFLDFIKNAKEGTYIFEGDRLFTGSLLHAIEEMAHVELGILLITAPQEVLEARYVERGSEQSEKFINSRRTKCDKIVSSMTLMPYVEEYRNVTFEDQQLIVGRVCTFIGA